jgi:putative oligomerization/nucleic acid binding protein
MRNEVAWLVAVVALLCLAGSGCSRSASSKDLATLDQAYKSGVLNKDEYEAKKAALESQSNAIKALDNALATGAITQVDYQAMKSRLIAKASALASIEKARQSGVLSQEEYLGKKSALLADDSTAAPASAAPAPVDGVPQDGVPQAVATAASSNEPPFIAQGSLKTINPVGGGKIVYGKVDGQTTEAGAMGAILRSLHNQLGDRPQVGKLFQVRGTQSVAAFFSVNKRNQGGGQISGLIIAAKVTSDHVEAALVSDDSARFPKTLSPMMKTLFSTWHPLADVAESGASGRPSGGPAPLRQVTLPDHSASVGLPEGWNIVPNRSSMGTIVAVGPNGETAELDETFLTYDTNNRSVQQTMQMLRNGRLANSAYARATYYPYGGDLAKTFVYIIQNVRRKAGLPQASYNFTSVTPVAGSGQERCVRMTGTADLGDGKGQRELNGIYCASPPGRFGGWLSEAYTTMAPVQVAAGERATLGAILQSFNVNMSVVNAQSARISAPAIAQIHAIGRAAANQAAAAHERNDIQNSSVYQRWDNNDKRSQEFENYQLGYSVISDTGNNAHATLWNEDAAALVQSNPDKYEYVTAPNYWKGIDY